MPDERTSAPSWLRWTLRLAATEVGARVLASTLPRFDRLLQRVSGGRVSLPRVMWWFGVPVVKLTTTGAKTGTARTVPVMGLRDGENWVVVASNWGRERHPAWYHNLKANPTVTVSQRDETGEYVAREATGEERDEYWAYATSVNPGLETYQERSGDRQIPIVVLEPNGE